MARRALNLSSFVTSVIACLACLYLSFSARLTGRALQRLEEGFAVYLPLSGLLKDFTFRYLLVIAVFVLAFVLRAYLKNAIALIAFVLLTSFLGWQFYLLFAQKIGYVFPGTDIGWFYIAFVLDILIVPSMTYALVVGLFYGTERETPDDHTADTGRGVR